MKRGITTCLMLGGISIVLASGTVEFPLSKRDASGQKSDVARGVLWKRQSTTGTVEESVYDVLPWSTGGAYYTNISVGTPLQVQTVILDTGSSDLYLDASDSSTCESTGVYSCRGGSFDSSKSSTFKVTDANGFSTAFGDGSSASGDYATDVVQIGDVAISNVQFGIATNVTSTVGFAVGLMGIGYSSNEASEVIYPNIPEVLVDSGVINSRLYSVFLNDAGDVSGTILFGGIDTSKYTGELYTLNLIPVPIETQDGIAELVYEFVVAVTGLSVTESGKTTTIFSDGAVDGTGSNSLPVLLDTGSAAWTVPSSVYEEIGALVTDLDDYGNVPCTSASENLTLALTFGGAAVINVPLSELVVPVYDELTNVQNTTSSGAPLCTFMLTPGEATTDQPFLTLGDAILRSMYVVFDLDNGQLSIAQANVNATSDAASSGSIKVVQAGVDGIAKAVGSSVSTTATNSGTIAPAASNTASYKVVTTTPAVATATGTDAVPDDGRVSENFGASSASGSGLTTGSGATTRTGTISTSASSIASRSTGGTSSGSAAASSSSKGVASGLVVPPFQMSILVSSAVVFIAAAAGAALML